MSKGAVEGFRLSPQQRRLWSLQAGARSSQEGAAAFRACCAVRVEGRVRAGLLREALAGVTRRHEILRTGFRLLPEMTLPLQFVGEHAAPACDEHDLTGLTPREQDARLDSLYAAAQRRVGDEGSGAPLAASLVKLTPERSVLLLSLPAMCADARSLQILAREIARAYAALGGDDAAPPAEEPLQYVDLVEWQNEALEGEGAGAAAGFWRGRVPAELLTCELPFERRAGADEGFTTGTLALRFAAAEWSKLEAAARRAGVEVSALLHACWQVLLWRLTGREEVLTGAAFDGREYAELEDALGLFARYLPVVGRPRADMPLADFARQLDAATREAGRWQEGFSWEVAPGSAPESSALPPFCPFAFDYDELSEPFTGGGATFSAVRRSVCLDRFRLKLSCVRDDGGLLAEFHHDTRALSREAVAVVARQFRTLASAASANADVRVSELELTCEEERRQLLEEFNATRADFSPALLVHQHFEAQAALAPDATAVVCEEARLSYRELNERANRLAHFLRARGVAPEVPVGLLLERSATVVVGMLAVLKAGGAFVPLEPSLPAERLAFMLRDAGARVLLARRRFAEQLAGHDAEVVCPDADAEAIAGSRADNPATLADGANLAYVLFTSGSTGHPKGVGVEHRQLVNYVRAVQARLELPPRAAYATVSTFAADLGHTAVFPSLCGGGCLHVISQERASDPDALADYFERHAIDVLKVVPVHFNALLAAARPERVVPRRALVLGGEAAGWELVEKVKALAPACAVFNHYGPTETTVGVLAGRVDEEPAWARTRRVPLGRPLANVRVYLLDERMRPAPLGVAGQLYVGGAPVTRGYLNRPARTAEVFVPDPFASEPGGRLYKTGDLARFLEDGRVEFLGRVDHQVKLHGYRIEVGEIEVALGSHGDVAECVVVAREDASGNRRLAAYLVARETPDGAANGLAEDCLRDFLKSKLPEYMIPSAFVTLGALPLTPNGKVDRKALPALKASRASAYVAPRNAVEGTLARIWAEVLRVERVGVEDNFFGLGGDSILSLQITARAHAAGIKLAPRQLFESPTVAGLAAAAEVADGGASEQGLIQGDVPLTRAQLDRLAAGDPHIEDVYTLSPAQQGMLYHTLLAPDSGVYLVQKLCTMRGLNVAAFERAWRRVVERHAILRTAFVWEGVDEPVQVVRGGVSIAFEQEDWRGLGGGEQEARLESLLREDRRRGFDLAAAPLMRLALVRLGEDSYRFVWTYHHLLLDGWCTMLVLKEVFDFYRASVRGEDLSLPLPRPYRDYIAWLRGQDLSQAEAFWREYLRGFRAPTPVELARPARRQEGERQGTPGADYAVSELRLGEGETAELQELARGRGLTLSTLVQGAWGLLLSRYGGGRDVVFGATVAGRPAELPGVEGMVGVFINTLPVRMRVGGREPVTEWLRELQSSWSEARVYEQSPLVEVSGWSELGRGARLFDSIVVFENYPVDENPEDQEASGLELADIRIVERNNYPLTLTAGPGRRMLLRLAYDDARFDEEAALRLLGHLRETLRGFVRAPESEVGRLDILTEEERRRLLFAWNDTRRDYSRDIPVHELFERQAAATPDATALVFEEESLTYAELNRRANRLAHRLRSLGVAPESLVGVCVGRSPRMVVALLGVLKAGGAYVPLDPSYPRERLSLMLEDARARVLITERDLRDALPRGGARLLLLDEDWPAVERESDENPPARTLGDNLAYVIYTSGSTGRPKGVQIPHRALSNFVCGMGGQLGVVAGDALLSVTTVSFDIAALELYLPLTRGARVVLAGREAQSDGRRLAELLARSGANVMQATPAGWRMLVEAGWRGDARLRGLCGGEALPADLVPKLLAGCSCLWNLYGPTETTIWSAAGQLGEGPDPVNVGRPIANTQIYLLDERLSPAPAGTPGALYIAGDGLARGYLNRPDLTAERFIPDPFSAEPGARMYATGDLARHLPDGRIEVLGRTDQQVKVRGFRVELGEIEAALAAHEAVSAAVVVAREEAPGDKRLFAYVVPAAGLVAGPEELRRFLKGKLPEYMLPSAFVTLDALPLTPNGKVDRKALPATDRARPRLEGQYVAPRNEVEETVAGVWSEVLGVERVGANDNFFDLGGHSLLAVQVISRLREAFRTELPLNVFLDSPTVAGFAEALASRQAEQSDGEDVERLLVELAQLSESEAEALLANDGGAADADD